MFGALGRVTRQYIIFRRANLLRLVHRARDSQQFLIPIISSKVTQIRMLHWECPVSSRDLQKARKMARRIRASVSCRTCRTAKSKCSDYRPCSRCRRLNSDCYEQGQESKDNYLQLKVLPDICRIRAMRFEKFQNFDVHYVDRLI